MSSHSKWFLSQRRESRADCRIFCFPYAGGSAAIYHGWQGRIAPHAEVIAVEYPGRGTRFCEPPISSLKELVGSLLQEILPCMDVPSIFFGHSNGALACYVLATELARRGLPLPEQLVLAAKRPPHLETREMLYRLPDVELMRKLQSLNGTSPQILSDPQLLKVFLPCIRADFALSETYLHEDCPPLPCEVTLLGGHTDNDVTPHQLREWSRYAARPPSLHLLTGDHFFVHTARQEIWRILAALVERVRAADR